MDCDGYYRELEQLRELAFNEFERCSVRGEGKAAFLFIEHAGRAVEVSKDADEWWVEYWEASEDENAPPVHEETLATAELAIRNVRDWFGKQ
jgi:hypothetical protein